MASADPPARTATCAAGPSPSGASNGAEAAFRMYTLSACTSCAPPPAPPVYGRSNGGRKQRRSQGVRPTNRETRCPVFKSLAQAFRSGHGPANPSGLSAGLLAPVTRAGSMQSDVFSNRSPSLCCLRAAMAAALASIVSRFARDSQAPLRDLPRSCQRFVRVRGGTSACAF